MKRLLCVVVGAVLTCAMARAEEDTATKLQEVESRIAKTPNDPMLFYRKAQYLMKLGRTEEGYQAAKDAMALFVEQRNELAWMMLEQIDLGHVRVDVHFNMGPGERRPPEIGIIRPLSFRVWTRGERPELLEIIDFEIAQMGGEPMSAALGQMTPEGGHANFGVLNTDATYAQIRERLVALVKSRHKAQP